jgi:hypothetical protein
MSNYGNPGSSNQNRNLGCWGWHRSLGFGMKRMFIERYPLKAMKTIYYKISQELGYLTLSSNERKYKTEWWLL